MEKPVITIENLTSVYSGGVEALSKINLTISQNEFVGIIGQNGAGKSTLLKNIIGLLKPTEGTVLVLGNDTREISVSELASKVGFVLQNPDLQLFAQTIREEVEFGPKNAGIEGVELDERVNNALATVGLEKQKEDFPLALSKGQRAKVVIASVLAMKPEVIILDEPTCGQDHFGCLQIMDIARMLHEEGKTIIVVTHNMALISEYAKRLLVFRKGTLFMDGTVEEVFSKPEELIKTHIKPPHVVRIGLSLKEELRHEAPVLTEEELGDLIIDRAGLKVERL